MRDKIQSTFLALLILPIFKLEAGPRPQNTAIGLSDVLVEPFQRHHNFDEEDFIFTNTFVPEVSESELKLIEEGSGSLEYTHERLSNFTENFTTNRIETASGRHDYNTIRKCANFLDEISISNWSVNKFC